MHSQPCSEIQVLETWGGVAGWGGNEPQRQTALAQAKIGPREGLSFTRGSYQRPLFQKARKESAKLSIEAICSSHAHSLLFGVLLTDT